MKIKEPCKVGHQPNAGGGGASVHHSGGRTTHGPALNLLQSDQAHAQVGFLAAGSILGFTNLSLPSLPTWLWVAFVPGLFVFSRTRPNLLRGIWQTVCCVGRYLNHCVRIASEYARSHPRAARHLAAGAMVAMLGVGALHSYTPLSAVIVLSGTLQAAYSAVVIALIIAAVRGSISLAADVRRAGCGAVRHADTIKQKYFRLRPPSLIMGV